MPSYTYTSNIPAAGNNPSVDQPNMKDNTNSIASIVDVDLYGFNDANGGTHQQVTIPLNVSPAAPTGLGAVVYTQPGTADSTKSQIYWQNSALPFPMTIIRAMGTCAGNVSGATSLLNGFNIASISRTNGNSTITVTMTTGAVSGTNYLVLASCTRATSPSHAISLNYAILSATQFTIQTYNIDSGAAVNGCDLVSFAVLQV